MVQYASGPKGRGRIATGLKALDQAGLQLVDGGVYLVMGARATGRTALLLEIAMRHVDRGADRSVLLVTEEAPEVIARRLLRRERLRIRANSVKVGGVPLLHPYHHLQSATDRIEALLCDRQLQVMEACPGTQGIRFDVALHDDPPLLTPTMVIVDGYSIVRTPLDVVREMVLHHSIHCQGLCPRMPPLLVGMAARMKHLREWPGLSLWEQHHVLDAADVTIVLQQHPGEETMIHAHLLGKPIPGGHDTVALSLDSSGSIDTP